MGGNALKNSNTKRLALDEFLLTQENIIKVLKEQFPTARIESIPSYSEKSSFGDLDLLISESAIKEYKNNNNDNTAEANPMKLLIAKLFNSQEQVENGTALSFDYKLDPKDTHGFQVDLIYTDDELFDFTKNYFSYNDLGNLIGQIAKKMNLKLGHQGLCYQVKNEDDCFATIQVSSDFYQSLEFLGLSSKRYKQGFQNLNEIFEYVTTSKYFTPELYQFENSSYKDRVRYVKRSTQQSFSKYCLELQKTEKNFYQFPENKDTFLPLIIKEFPGFESNLNKAWNFFNSKKHAKKYFNSKYIGNLVNLKDQNLGLFMNHIRKEFKSPVEFYSWMSKHSESDFKQYIKTSLADFNQIKETLDLNTPERHLLKVNKLKL